MLYDNYSHSNYNPLLISLDGVPKCMGAEQYQESATGVDILQSRAESGQPNVHGTPAPSVHPQRVYIPPGRSSTSRDDPIGTCTAAGAG